MHIPISKEQHERLSKHYYIEYVFGSHLFKTNGPDSDTDVVRIYDFNDVFGVPFSNYSEYPNYHGFHYTDVENKLDVIWLSLEQYLNSIYRGDSTICIDICMFTNNWSIEKLRTYKIIKAYLGTAKRDVTMHKNNNKKTRNAIRCIIIAKNLINNKILTIDELNYEVNNWITLNGYNKSTILSDEACLRTIANDLYNKQELHNYPQEKYDDDLLDLLINSNNIRNFKF